MNTTSLNPTLGEERIDSLDILRGFAILGILIMNIQSFSMPGPAYLNPMAFGDMTGANKWVWILSHIFGDQKFMTIFSILYGAGVVMVTQNAEKKTGKSASLHYRRTFWLLIIGLIHAHLIWYGDILVPYALCAIFIYFFRNVRPTILLVVGVLLIAVHTLLYVGLGSSIAHWPQESINQTMQSWNPGQEKLDQEIAAYTGSFSDQLSVRVKSALFLETFVFLMMFLWRAGGLMLVGMALYKWGILTAERSRNFYIKGWMISWVIGMPIVIYGVYKNFDANWALEYAMFIGSQFNYWGSLGVSFGLICAIMILSKSGSMTWFRERLAGVGRMALTNYLMQSVICTFIFYGIGISLFGQVDRVGQVGIVLLVWIIQLLWSKPWIRKYRFGPAEWMWRSLTYLKRQKMIRE